MTSAQKSAVAAATALVYKSAAYVAVLLLNKWRQKAATVKLGRLPRLPKKMKAMPARSVSQDKFSTGTAKLLIDSNQKRNLD